MDTAIAFAKPYLSKALNAAPMGLRFGPHGDLYPIANHMSDRRSSIPLWTEMDDLVSALGYRI